MATTHNRDGTDRRRAPTIGIIVEADHPVYSVVADELRKRGYEIRRFEPQRRIEHAEIDELGLLVNKRMFPESFHALLYADRTDVPTWNSFVSNVVFSARLIALHALEKVGFSTPDVYFDKPADGEYVAKSLFDMDTNHEPVIGGEGEFYQEMVRSQHVDYKYYAVIAGDEFHTCALKVRSKLFGDKKIIGRVEPEPGITDRIHRLMELTGARGVGVDIVKGDEVFAVDVNPAPSFEGTGLESELVDSMAAVLVKEHRA